MKTYRLHETVGSLFHRWGLLALLLILPVLIVIDALRPNSPIDNLALVTLGLFWCMALVVAARVSLRIPTTIELGSNGTVTFRAPLRADPIAVADIVAIAPLARNIGVLVVEHRDGKVRILNQFDGFHELLQELRQMNPSIQLRGC